MSKDRKQLAALKCVPCRGGVPPLADSRIKEMLPAVPGWTRIKDEGIGKIQREFKFKDFKASMAFVNQVADIAEEQGHHPNILIDWNKVTLTLWTHAIKGLFDNDFIMAAKIDEIR